ncbi:MAG: hypothetical protein ACJA2Q_002659, partial [Pseudohongiellaceae bacterium]
MKLTVTASHLKLSRFLISLACLPLASLSWANCDYSTGTAETIRGSVFIETNSNNRRDRIEAGIAGVSVSNGCDVVQTDAGGNYQIAIHPTQILFISKPAEYDVPVDEYNVPQFFYKHYPNGTPTQIAGTSVAWEWPVIEATGPLPSFIN